MSYVGIVGKRHEFYLQVVKSVATDRNNETLWIFKDEENNIFEWWTISSRLLLEKRWYYLKAAVKCHHEGRTIIERCSFSSFS